jgi:hypothetical protein
MSLTAAKTRAKYEDVLYGYATEAAAGFAYVPEPEHPAAPPAKSYRSVLTKQASPAQASPMQSPVSVSSRFDVLANADESSPVPAVKPAVKPAVAKRSNDSPMAGRPPPPATPPPDYMVEVVSKLKLSERWNGVNRRSLTSTALVRVTRPVLLQLFR